MPLAPVGAYFLRLMPTMGGMRAVIFTACMACGNSVKHNLLMCQGVAVEWSLSMGAITMLKEKMNKEGKRAKTLIMCLESQIVSPLGTN